MKRVYFVRDERGERTLTDSDLPLMIGGADVANVVLPDFPATRQVAYLALAEGHIFLQPADAETPVFHNHERLQNSAWMKSGDLIEIDRALLRWTVRGDQVVIEVDRRPSVENRVLVPPAEPPQAPLPDNNSLPEVSPVGRRRSRLRYLTAGLLGLLLLVAMFVLLATPIRITVEPQPEHMALHGFPPPLALWGRYLSLPGNYTLHARREGYHALRESLVVDNAGQDDFRFALLPLPGLVVIDVDPPVAFALTVDGAQVVANARGFFPVQQGPHRMRLDTERYLTEEREVEIEGLGRQQRVEFELRPAWADVRIITEPAGAIVHVDGEMRGATPLATEIMHGMRDVQLALPGHKTVVLQQQVNAGEALTLNKITLAPADGQLVVRTEPAGATVSVDGEFHGRTPVTLALAPAAAHAVSIAKAGYVRVQETATLQADEERVLQVDLRPEMGTVFLTSRPADASLSIDGRPAGSATRRLRLSTRPHLLEIRKPGYTSRRVTVTPSAAASQSVEVTLPKPGQTTTAPPQSRAAGGLSGQHTTSGGYTLTLIRPTGSFSMGASRREPGRRANESRRTVELTRPFLLGVKEVSNAQFRQFRASHRAGVADGADLDGADQPVVNVSWDDAARYCNWLSAQEGLPSAYEERGGAMRLVRPAPRGYRLPTEAEWAYAARVYRRSQQSSYPWAGGYPPTAVTGNYADARIADTLAEVVPAGYDDGHRGPAPVGSYPASPPGFYDLSGNVAEWVNDYYTVYPAAAQTLVRNPLGPDAGQHRVVRGSSWRHANITELRLSYRDYSKRPRKDLGFRIARYAEE